MYQQTASLTPRDSRRIAKRTRCLDLSSRPDIRKFRKRMRTWRNSYSASWMLRRRRVSAPTLQMLARLRGCETRGLAFPSNYRFSGHHHGAYQYLAGTWQRAQSYYHAVTGQHVKGATSVAYLASPAHQDVVTAYFFPAHRSEWACSA